MRNKIITVFFCLLLGAAPALSLIMPDKYYSESEKRKLTLGTDIKPTEYVSGSFQSTLESYLADQFPGRDGWIALKTLMDLAGGRRDSGGVYFASDGYLIQTFLEYDEENFRSKTEELLELSNQLEDVTFTVILVPTAACILEDKLPAFAPGVDQSELIAYVKAQGLNVTDVTDILKAHSGEYIYYRTDHHYTSLGAYYCYAAYRKSLGLSVSPAEEFTSEVLSDDFRGTSYAKVNYPLAVSDTITAYYKHDERRVSYNNDNYVTDSIYEKKYLNGRDQYAVFCNSNQAQTVIEGSGTGGKLLLVKDSFGNTFAQFPAEDYQEVHMLDLRFWRGSVTEYVEENGITDVLVLYGLQNYANDVTFSENMW